MLLDLALPFVALQSVGVVFGSCHTLSSLSLCGSGSARALQLIRRLTEG